MPHVLVDFVVPPPGHGRSVTDFRGWDAHEGQLRCPDDVSGDRFVDIIWPILILSKFTYV